MPASLQQVRFAFERKVGRYRPPSLWRLRNKDGNLSGIDLNKVFANGDIYGAMLKFDKHFPNDDIIGRAYDMAIKDGHDWSASEICEIIVEQNDVLSIEEVTDLTIL